MERNFKLLEVIYVLHFADVPNPGCCYEGAVVAVDLAHKTVHDGAYVVAVEGEYAGYELALDLTGFRVDCNANGVSRGERVFYDDVLAD